VDRLNIGCGPEAAAGWHNVDIRYPERWWVPGVHAEHGQFQLSDVTKGLIFAAGWFQRVEMHHLISGLEYDQIPPLLAECHRVLASGGALRISDCDPRLLFTHWRLGRVGLLPCPDEVDDTLDGKLCRSLICGSRRSLWTADMVERALLAAGFAKIHHGWYSESELDTRPDESFFVEGWK
jgi:hypothetical protein